MELADLLESHVVMYSVNAKVKQSISANLFLTYDISDYMEASGHSIFMTMFRFDSMITLAANAYGLRQRFTFDDDIVWGAYSSPHYYANLYIYAVQDQDAKVHCKIQGLIGTRHNDSGELYLDVGKNYAMTTSFWPDASYDGYIYSTIYEVDDEGQVVSKGSCSTGETIYATGFPVYHLVTLSLANVQVQMRVYETCLFAHNLLSFKQGLPSLWNPRRLYYWTYYEHACYTPFLMPPKAIMDGSAYDRAAALLTIIDENRVEIDDLTIDLATAQTDLDTLKSRLSVTLVTYINTCFATITSWITGIDVEILKIAGAFGATGKFSLATLDAALSDIINAGFDAMEDAM